MIGGTGAGEKRANEAAPIEVLLLDVGGVLVPAADPAEVAASERELSLPPGGLAALLYEGDPWYGLSTGMLDEEEYWRALATRIGREPDDMRRLLYPVWDLTRLDPEVVALAEAARRGVRVAILSNATLHLEERLTSLGVARLFDPIINSARVGLRKPDPRLFSLTLDRLQAAPAAVLFVDDKPRNTRVARDLGIPSHDFVDAAGLATALRAHGMLPPAHRLTQA